MTTQWKCPKEYAEEIAADIERGDFKELREALWTRFGKDAVRVAQKYMRGDAATTLPRR